MTNSNAQKISGNKAFKLSTKELKNIDEVEQILNYTFKRKHLLILALTHRSYINTLKKIKGFYYNNERIEFLGDAVLELAVSEFLYKNYPNLPEGLLTTIRAAAVKTDTLARILKSKGLHKFIILGKGEEATGGRDKNYILANVFEAIVGAIYLDGGFKNAKKFLQNTVLDQIDNIISKKLYIDAKTKLQEEIQRYFKITPTYEIIKEQGKAHQKIFFVNVKINDIILGTGKGASKREAEENAADRALLHLNKLIKKTKNVKNKTR